MENEKKTLLCFDALNWTSAFFWNNKADLQWCARADPWEALRYSDRTVNTFVKAARNADFELVVVIAGGGINADAIAKYEWRREQEIMHEKRGVCLGADTLLAESFQSHGVRVVRPIDADAIDVLAAFADSVEGAVIVSRNRLFFCYDKPLLVSGSFTVTKGKLLLESPVTRNDVHFPIRSKMSFVVQQHLALSHETWSLGLVTKYRPSLRSHGRLVFGSSSSSDRRMGNLHVIARALRAAVYASLGEKVALERIPEWCNDETVVVWTETEVVADPGLISVLKDPLSVVEWLEKYDTPVVAQLEPWREAERHFNICSLAAELVAVSSHGNWTMHKCMEIFSNDADIIKRTSRGAETSAELEDGRNTFLDARRNFAKLTKNEQAQQLQSSPLNLLPEIAKNENENSSSKSRVSIFGIGRPREEVLKERGKQNGHQ